MLLKINNLTVPHFPSRNRFARVLLTLATASLLAGVALMIANPQGVRAQVKAVDPGLRTGTAGAGQFIKGLSTDQKSTTSRLTQIFTEINNVTGGTQQKSVGLGPLWNSNSCNSCHGQPAVGGSSPVVNPLFAIFNVQGGTNTMPFFNTTTGPVNVVRFAFQSDGVTPDGGVHNLFTIAGRTDAPGCNVGLIAQPDFAGASAAGNLRLRLTTPTFGDGLMEIIRDRDIVANMNSNLTLKQSLGISGHPNRVDEDGTISRFGWKAQNKSLIYFSGEAYNVEVGISNELFPNERNETPGCTPPFPTTSGFKTHGVPDDRTDPTAAGGKGNVNVTGDQNRFSLFMRFLDQPTPAASTPSTINGQTVFNNIGCNLCHTQSFTTPTSAIAALSNVQTNLYSDLLVHRMGPNLADDITQGTAGPDEFRTAPLWGVGQRTFFLHDGRTSDIVQAIEQHGSLATSKYPASEANAVIGAFNALSQSDQQDLINFLRSL